VKKLELNNNGLENQEPWKLKGFETPKYDRNTVREKTLKSPTWVHFGAGNIFRGFLAAVQEQLLNEGKSDQGIIVCEGFDYEIIDRIYKPYDDLSLLVVLKPDGNVEKKVVASVVESLKMEDTQGQDWEALSEVFENPTLQMVSFTITEKGYSLTNAKNEYFKAVEEDFENGPTAPKSLMGRLAALCYKRYQKGKLPVALVSMDNCSHNGTKLYQAVSQFAKAWTKKGLVEEGFNIYIDDPKSVSFPWSMIDKITPRPDHKIKEALEKDGFKSTEVVCTAKNTYIAPFVNAEEPQYLVIEDLFPNGRPALDQGGIIFTDRETVDKVEKMKVCTCLNPLHTALAVYGCLLSYTTIWEEMKDDLLNTFVQKIAYNEGLPVVTNPGIVDPKAFVKEVLEVRFPNPFVPDTPQRIATDTSQKLAIRFGETIKAYQSNEGLDPTDLKLIPLVLAGWCRYLLGVDDKGNPFDISPDPMLDIVSKHLEGIQIGDKGSFKEQLQPILSDEKIFGVNLYEVGLNEKVENYFSELIASEGAVRATLEKYVYSEENK
jgi:fructuronate reductase